MSLITRAQAEALLTLAESLEACERLGVDLCVSNHDTQLISFGPSCFDEYEVSDFSATEIRLAVNALVPKHTGS